MQKARDKSEAFKKTIVQYQEQDFQCGKRGIVLLFSWQLSPNHIFKQSSNGTKLVNYAKCLKFINSKFIHFTSVDIPWETISFEVCPGTGYPKEPPWDRPTPIDCILVVNHGRGCIVVVNSDRTLSPLLPFLGTLSPIVCSGPTWGPRGLSGQWTGPKVSLLIWCYSSIHTYRQTGIQIHPGKYWGR